MNKKQKVFIGLTVIGTILLIFSSIISAVEYGGNFGTTKDIQTKCYDRYSNKINGLTCEKEVIDEYDLEIVYLLSLGIIFIILGLIGLFAISEVSE